MNKKRLKSNILSTAIAPGITLLLYLAFILYSQPVQVITVAERYLIYCVIFILGGTIGFNISLFFSLRQRFNFSFVCKIATLLGTVLFLALRPEVIMGINNSTRLFSPLIIAIVGSICFFYLKRKYFHSLVTGAISSKQWVWMLSIVIPMLIAILGLVKPIFMYWDVSGWMDSHTYDLIAHQIITGVAPQGNSYYMPLYQYGMALIYYVFGHFFYIQQIVNLLMALATIVLLSLTAWNLFRSIWAVLLIGIWAAFTTQLHHAIWYTQIENWYVPIFCLTVFLWSCYWRKPLLSHLVLFSISIGFALNTRTQGAFFFVFLFLSPFFISDMTLWRRFAHSLITILIVGMSLLPWTIRNYVYEHRLSPSSDQAIIGLCLFNDHRVGFYGNRYDIGYLDVLKEYEQKYPNKLERFKFMKRDAYRNIFGDLRWFAKAVFWRSAAFYGLLPPGVWAPEGPRPTDWRQHWQSYIYWNLPVLFFICVFLLGFISRAGKITIFLALAILGNFALVVFAAPAEPRMCYPVLALHMLAGLCVFFEPVRYSSEDNFSLLPKLFYGNKKTYCLVILLSAIIFSLLSHRTVGKHYLCRPLIEKATLIDKKTEVNPNLSPLDQYFESLKRKETATTIFQQGEKVRVKCQVTNYMLPPKFAGAITYLPQFATDPLRETYYYAYPLSGGIVGITYFGATMNTIIRENDIVEVEGIVVLYTKNNVLRGLDYWLKAEKVVFIRKG